MAVKFRLVALDLDGTTLNSSHKLSDHTVQCLQKLSASGVIIVLATGRGTVDILKHFDLLGLSQNKHPGVSYNGACSFIGELKGGERVVDMVTQYPLTQSHVSEVLSFAQEQNLVVQYYNSHIGEIFAAPKNDEHRALLGKYAFLAAKPQVIVENYDEVIEQGLPSKMLVLSSNGPAVAASARERFPNNEFNIILGSPEPFFVEFLRPDASKGAGLVELCKHLEIPMNEVVAFGDGDNDKEMLQFAGRGVAMKNAKQAAKSAADEVMEWTNDEDGVALYLERMISDGLFQI